MGRHRQKRSDPLGLSVHLLENRSKDAQGPVQKHGRHGGGRIEQGSQTRDVPRFDIGTVEQPLDEGRRHMRGGDAVRLDVRQNSCGIIGPVQIDHAAHPLLGQGDRLRADMEQGHHQQRAIVPPQLHGCGDDGGGGHFGLVLQHAPLGTTGGAAGVDQIAEVVRTRRRQVGTARRPAFEKGVPGFRPVEGFADDDEAFNPFQSRADGRDLIGEDAFKDQDPGAAVLDDVAHLHWRQPEVDRRRDKAVELASAVDRRQLQGVHRQDRNAILSLHAGLM